MYYMLLCGLVSKYDFHLSVNEELFGWVSYLVSYCTGAWETRKKQGCLNSLSQKAISILFPLKDPLWNLWVMTLCTWVYGELPNWTPCQWGGFLYLLMTSGLDVYLYLVWVFGQWHSQGHPGWVSRSPGWLIWGRKWRNYRKIEKNSPLAHLNLVESLVVTLYLC